MSGNLLENQPLHDTQEMVWTSIWRAWQRRADPGRDVQQCGSEGPDSRHHPLRKSRKVNDLVLTSMTAEFDAMYNAVSRPWITPEHLISALLLQVFFTIRSERMLMEQLDYNLLFRWLVGLSMEDVSEPTVFSKNRDRLLNQEVADGSSLASSNKPPI